MQKIRNWFNYRSNPKSRTSPSPSLFAPKPRKVVWLTNAQAYSHVFCKPGSALHDELYDAWRHYAAADEDALKTYQHLFSVSESSLPFVAFQQRILKDKVLTATEDELLRVESYIKEHFEAQKKQSESPWTKVKASETQTEAELKRRYVEQYVLPPFWLQPLTDHLPVETCWAFTNQCNMPVKR